MNKEQTTTEPPITADSVVKAFKASWGYREGSWHTNWENMNKLYNSERVFVGYNGISDTVVPMAYSTVETMVAGTAGDKPLVEYIPTKAEQNTNTEVLNSLFSFYWDIDGWTPKMVQHSRGLFKLGTAVIRMHWNIDHPVMQIIPLKDYFCDPSATYFDYENASYMGHRFKAKLSELKKEQVVDPQTKELVPKYKNLDKLDASSDISESTAKEDADQRTGATTETSAKSDEVEIICYETKDEFVYVGNRKEIIYEGINLFKERQQFLGVKNPKGMFSYVVDSYSPDESQLYGKSVIDPIAKPIEMLNDLTNQNIDAVSWALDPEMELDPQYSSYLGKMQSATGNIYPFKPGSYSAVKKPLMPSGVFTERTNIKNEIREVTAIDQIIKGIAASGDTTATEVKAQVASAGRRFNLLVSMLEDGGYYKIARLVYQMIQLYVTQPTQLRIVGENGVEWKTYDPAIFQGDYEPRVKLKATLESEKQAKVRDYKEMYSAMVGNPNINERNLTKYVLRKAFNLTLEEAADLVKSEQDMANNAPQPDPKTDPKTQALLALVKKIDKLPPDIQTQIEELAGLDSSATHQDAMTTQLTGHMANQAQHMGQIHESLMGPMPQDQGTQDGQPA